MGCFEGDGTEHLAVGVPPRWVVPRLDPVEDGECQLLASDPAVFVQQLELQGPEEALDGAVGPHRQLHRIAPLNSEPFG